MSHAQQTPTSTLLPVDLDRALQIAACVPSGIYGDSVAAQECIRQLVAMARQMQAEYQPTIITLTVGQLLQAIELGGCEADTELCLQFKPDGKDPDGDDAPAGVYCWVQEYPEEGAIRLDPHRVLPPAYNPALVDACRNLIAYLDKHPPMGDSIWSVRQIRDAMSITAGNPTEHETNQLPGETS